MKLTELTTMARELTNGITSSDHSVVSLNHRFLFLTLSLCQQRKKLILTSLTTNTHMRKRA